MATNLDHYLGSNCVHRRMEEGEEDPTFKRLFGNAIKVLPGGTGSREAAAPKPDTSRLRLLLVSGHEQHHREPQSHDKMRVTEVPLAWDSLDEGELFVLDAVSERGGGLVTALVLPLLYIAHHDVRLINMYIDIYILLLLLLLLLLLQCFV